MRADYIKSEYMGHLLAALMEQNRIACEVSLASGLRIGDVLSLKARDLPEGDETRFSVRESKTGKLKRVRLPVALLDELRAIAGKIYVFEARSDYRRHRTRQAVYKDIKRAAKLFRLPERAQVSPHSLRKIYAVGAMKKYGDLRKVQTLLNHDNEAVTQIYALADILTERRLGAEVAPRQGGGGSAGGSRC